MQKLLLILALAGMAHADTVEPVVTGGPGSYIVAGFDSALGTLTSVYFQALGVFHRTDIFKASSQYKDGVNDAIQLVLTEHLHAILKDSSASQFALYDTGELVFSPAIVAPPPGQTPVSLLAHPSIAQTLTAQLTPFLSNWTVALSDNQTNDFSDWAAGVTRVSSNSSFAIDHVVVIYTYSPASAPTAVPEPKEWIGMAGAAMVALLNRKRLVACLPDRIS